MSFHPRNIQMETKSPFGVYLYQKESPETGVLKELLQLMKCKGQGKFSSFAYVEAETSLIPTLSLWENLQLVSGGHSFKEVSENLSPELSQLLKLVKDPHKKAKSSEAWEKFLLSLVKGLVVSNHHLLVDMNEDLLSPFMVQNFKRTLLKTQESKNIFLASASTSLWLDCAHSVVTRKEYDFVVNKLDAEKLKLHWAA